MTGRTSTLPKARLDNPFGLVLPTDLFAALLFQITVADTVRVDDIEPRRRASRTAQAKPVLPDPDGPVDPTVSAYPVDGVDRPARFTLMAPGWMPPLYLVTQALGLCFTADHSVVMVTWDGQHWTFPGGTVEGGETIEQALIREVAEEACARVVSCKYLAAQHVADPLNPNGRPSHYQTRWWTRVELDPWRPQHEMVARRLVTPDQVLPTLCWSRKEVAGRLLNLAVQIDRQH